MAFLPCQPRITRGGSPFSVDWKSTQDSDIAPDDKRHSEVRADKEYKQLAMIMELAVCAPYVEEREGALWVTGTRVSLDSVVYAYRQGRSPERITASFPSLTLEQAYGTIAFYLAHQAEVDAYLKAGEARAEELQRQSREDNRALIEKLQAARGASPG